MMKWCSASREVPEYFKGTSNVYQAMRVRPGTYRHHGA
jgi:hypothetical protein